MVQAIALARVRAPALSICNHQTMNSEFPGWDDEDDALLAYEALPDWHPALFVDTFRAGLEHPGFPAEGLAAFVTPESLSSWGNFDRARDVFESGLKISTTPMYGVDAPDVAYVRLVETSGHINERLQDVPATMHATLVWRPEIAVVPCGCWRIHYLGELLEPNRVPRSAPGFDPRTQL